jgi:molybdopterin synthase catalytic subunit
MLTLSQEPLDDTKLRKELFNPSAGALVVFEGTVRARTHDRDVVRLEYEGAEPLAQNEFSKIVDEARAQFEFIEARCAHRVGILRPGEVAVWIGVTSAHRSAAFAACKYLIDEVKKRLPIWKKEHYADGASAWINAP